MAELSARQMQVLEYIAGFVSKHGVSPSFREIGEGLQIRSTNGVSDHVRALERKGFVERARGHGRARAIRLTDKADAVVGSVPVESPANTRSIPMIGRIAAGLPLMAVEDETQRYSIDADLLPRGGDVFALEVHGDSMIEDGIHDGDFVFVQRGRRTVEGEIVAVMVDGEATVKRVYRDGGRLRLQPANASMAPIYVASDVSEIEVIGPVVGLYRKY